MPSPMNLSSVPPRLKNDAHHHREVLVQQRYHFPAVQFLRQRGEVADIGEEDRDLPVFARIRSARDARIRSATAGEKKRPSRSRGSARGRRLAPPTRRAARCGPRGPPRKRRGRRRKRRRSGPPRPLAWRGARKGQRPRRPRRRSGRAGPRRGRDDHHDENGDREDGGGDRLWRVTGGGVLDQEDHRHVDERDQPLCMPLDGGELLQQGEGTERDGAVEAHERRLSPPTPRSR